MSTPLNRAPEMEKDISHPSWTCTTYTKDVFQNGIFF